MIQRHASFHAACVLGWPAGRQAPAPARAKLLQQTVFQHDRWSSRRCRWRRHFAVSAAGMRETTLPTIPPPGAAWWSGALRLCACPKARSFPLTPTLPPRRSQGRGSARDTRNHAAAKPSPPAEPGERGRLRHTKSRFRPALSPERVMDFPRRRRVRSLAVGYHAGLAARVASCRADGLATEHP